MTEELAKEILGDTIQSDGSLFCLGHYIAWQGGNHVVLDDSFEIEELEAILWWIKHKE